MPGNIVSQPRSQPVSRPSFDRRTARSLYAVHSDAVVRMARVQGESLVQTEKVKEIDHLTREAMTGHALLRRWGDTLASGDPFLADEMRFFTDVAKMGKGEVIADTIDTYCRESRGVR
jgi:hypothetical protein